MADAKIIRFRPRENNKHPVCHVRGFSPSLRPSKSIWEGEPTSSWDSLIFRKALPSELDDPNELSPEELALTPEERRELDKYSEAPPAMLLQVAEIHARDAAKEILEPGILPYEQFTAYEKAVLEISAIIKNSHTLADAPPSHENVVSAVRMLEIWIKPHVLRNLIDNPFSRDVFYAINVVYGEFVFDTESLAWALGVSFYDIVSWVRQNYGVSFNSASRRQKADWLRTYALHDGARPPGSGAGA